MDDIKVQISANATPVDAALKETTESTDSLAAALKRSETAGVEASKALSEGMQRASYSTLEARESARLLSEETGVRLPRALSNLLAKSEALGPLLASAFSVVAVGAFVPVVEEAATKLTDLISNTWLYDAADKALDADMKSTTKELVERNAKIKELDRELRLLGKTTAEQKALKLRFDTEDAEAGIKKLQASITALDAQAKTTTESTWHALADGIAGYFGLPQVFLGRTLQDIENLKTQGLNAAAVLRAANQENAAQQKVDARELAEATQEEADAAERSFEQRLSAAERFGIRERAEAKKLTDAHQQQVEEDERLSEQGFKILSELHAKQVEEENKAASELRDAYYRETEDHIKAVASLAETQLTGKKDARLVSEQEYFSELKAIHDQEHDELVAFLQQEKATIEQNDPYGPERVKKLAQVDAQLERENDRHNQQMARDDAAAYAKQEKALDSYLKTFNSEFASSFAQVMTGQETVGKAASKMFLQMEESALQSFARIALAELEGLALHKSMAAEQKLTDAKTAAAGAWSAVSGVPIIGPIIAPAAAAAAFAGVMAFEDGGIVPRTQMALVHEREMVLPAHLSQAFQDMVARGGGGGGDTHHHYHINAVDASGVENFFRKNARAVGAGVTSAVANGHLNLTKLQRGK